MDGGVHGSSGRSVTALDYIREPEAIYEHSFATIAGLPELARWRNDAKEVATRVVHACGMPDAADDLRISAKAIEVGRRALGEGVDIFLDVESLRPGIMRHLLPRATQMHCAVFDERTRDHARAHGMTRSAAQIDLWGERLKGQIVVIGNAPTALFRLLERIDDGLAPPALVIAFPVGFVGAAESKDALVQNPRGLEYVTLLGRRGGTAMAQAAMNAIAGGLGR